MLLCYSFNDHYDKDQSLSRSDNKIKTIKTEKKRRKKTKARKLQQVYVFACCELDV